MKIRLPVKCQNGHKADSYFVYNYLAMAFYWKPPSKEESCACPKSVFGEGWSPAGKPVVVREKKAV